MNVKHFFAAFFALIIISTILPAACIQPGEKAVVYDTSKKYVAFIVVNAGNSAAGLANAKNISISGEGYEQGPVEFYEPGTTDFTAISKKVTPSPQINLIWVVGSLLDAPKIQKALAAAGYKSGIRYMPVTLTSQPAGQNGSE